MSDWYEKGLELLYEHGVEETGIQYEDFCKVYSFLNSIGIIDYDIEKEIIWDSYISDEEEEEEDDE